MSFRADPALVNDDNDQPIETKVDLPWAGDPAGSYLYYDCTVGCMLDSGIVVHNRLPQINRTADTLSSTSLDAPDLETITNLGVNLNCNDQYTDIVQRMGHARYWFRLWGRALRVGYQVPIPAIKTIGGVSVVPYDKNTQWAFNKIVPCGNFGGVILWGAAWSLWYTTATPPITSKIFLADPAGHINSETPVPTTLRAPTTRADDNARPGQAQSEFLPTTFGGSKPGR